MNKKIVIVGFVVVIAIGLFTIYQYLGGSEPLAFEQSQREFWFMGHEYHGRFNDPAIEKFFVSARDATLQNKDYTLTVLNKKASKDTLHQVIGVISQTPFKSTLSDSVINQHFNQDFVATVIKSHNLVMPKPEEVLAKAKDFAQSKPYTVDESFTLEVYQSERALEVLFPIAQ